MGYWSTLIKVSVFIKPHQGVANSALLQQAVHDAVTTALDATPSAPWQAQLWDLILALPPAVTPTTALTALRAAWPVLRPACLLCHPTETPPPLNVERLRTGLATGELPYQRATLERVLCAACWTAHNVQEKWQAYQQRVNAEARRRDAAQQHWAWQRRLAHYARGTGTPAGISRRCASC